MGNFQKRASIYCEMWTKATKTYGCPGGELKMSLGRRSGFTLLALAITIPGFAQQKPTDKADEEKGFTYYETFQGSTNELGQVMKLDTTVGYQFTRHFGVDFGVPFYFVSPSSTETSSGGASHNGIGDAYAEIRATFNNPLVNYATVLTGAAPTGDTKSGLSTGRAMFDWTNHFDKGVLGLRPFVNVGVANTISDTTFFTRPFTTLGMNTHEEGGISWSVLPFVRVGASYYAIEPWGTQKVFSKFRPSVNTVNAPPKMGRSHGPFQNALETIGTSDLTRDNGFSAWVSGRAFNLLDLELGYERSVKYDLNTVSFLVGFNFGSLVRKARGF